VFRVKKWNASACKAGYFIYPDSHQDHKFYIQSGQLMHGEILPKRKSHHQQRTKNKELLAHFNGTNNPINHSLNQLNQPLNTNSKKLILNPVQIVSLHPDKKIPTLRNVRHQSRMF